MQNTADERDGQALTLHCTVDMEREAMELIPLCPANSSEEHTSDTTTGELVLAELQMGTCQIGADPSDDTNNVYIMPCCRFEVCPSCLNSYILTEIDSGNIDIYCPAQRSRCGVLVELQTIKGVVSDETYKRLDYLRVNAGKDVNRKACQKCKNIELVNDSVAAESNIVCSQCGPEWCFQCGMPSHKGVRCAQHKVEIGDTKVDQWARGSRLKGARNGQQCPDCKAWCERTEGCYFIKCRICNTNFCYDCGVKVPHPANSSCKHGQGRGIYEHPHILGHRLMGRFFPQLCHRHPHCSVFVLIGIVMVVGCIIGAIVVSAHSM